MFSVLLETGLDQNNNKQTNCDVTTPFLFHQFLFHFYINRREFVVLFGFDLLGPVCQTINRQPSLKTDTIRLFLASCLGCLEHVHVANVGHFIVGQALLYIVLDSSLVLPYPFALIMHCLHGFLHWFLGFPKADSTHCKHYVSPCRNQADSLNYTLSYTQVQQAEDIRMHGTVPLLHPLLTWLSDPDHFFKCIIFHMCWYESSNAHYDVVNTWKIFFVLMFQERRQLGVNSGAQSWSDMKCDVCYAYYTTFWHKKKRHIYIYHLLHPVGLGPSNHKSTSWRCSFSLPLPTSLDLGPKHPGFWNLHHTTETNKK